MVEVEFPALGDALTRSTLPHQHPGRDTALAIKIFHQEALGALAPGPGRKIFFGGYKSSRGQDFPSLGCREIRQEASKPPARRVDDRSAVASQHLVVGISAQKLHSVAQFMGAMTKGREYQVSFLAMISPPAQWAEHFGHEHRSPVIKMGTELIGKE